MKRPSLFFGLLAALPLAALPAHADEVTVAVAANFAAPTQQIAAQFTQDTGHKLLASFGSTGKFYAQIKNGAPFEVLLSADEATPRKLMQEGAAVNGSAFSYALGTLVLWSPKPGLVDGAGNVLKTGNFAHLAVADPKLAPYGAASMQTLNALGIMERVQSKLVTAENIGQAFQFIASGNAELGFVARSQLPRDDSPQGSFWMVPSTLYAPIRQDAVLLQRGQGKAAALALLKYLRGDKARAIIQSFGYGL